MSGTPAASAPAPAPAAASPSAPSAPTAPISRRVMNLAHFLTQAARRHPARVALAWGDRQWTWRELDDRVSSLARALTRHGIGKGDRVLVHSKNGNEMFEAMFAVFRLGAIWVPTNFRVSPEDVLYIAESCQVNAFLCHEDFPAHAEMVRAAVPDLALLASVGGARHLGGAAASHSSPFGFPAPSLAALIDAEPAEPFPNAQVEYDDRCWYFLTSGTTGRPKAAMLTHGQMAFVVTNHLCDLMPGTTEEDAALLVAPLSHGAGVHHLIQVARAVKTVMPANERFDAAECWRLVAEHRITNMFTVPTIVKMLVEHPAVHEYDHSSLRYVIYAGAPMYRADQQRALAVLGKIIVQYFGLGEVTGNITVLPAALHDGEDTAAARVGTCGFERTGMQVSIQDADGVEVATGATGEICACGPAVFAGYYDNPEANAKAFRNGWFRTGDLGHVDAEGFVYITGRESDMYICGGSNIYPREIEEKILMHPAIAETAVLGMPDPTWGEIGVAVCVARDGQQVDEAALLAWLDTRVARYKLPRRVVLWTELPKSGYGKITKKIIRDALIERQSLEIQSNGSKP